MQTNFKPDNYNSACPYLVVDDAAKAIAFMVEVFQAQELRRFADETGRIAHAEVRLDDSIVMLGEGSTDWPAFEAYVHVYVPDVDSTYHRALKAGAVSIQEPIKRDDADKRAAVKLGSGTCWWIATKVE